ncbi:MAG: cysteine peptidase family C39 domain-containing protein, partial [Cellvibrionaceae bacterium]|nr:cysteine peptidase family C39 domain-containing protein [Cellvibrionaceae bacterium]
MGTAAELLDFGFSKKVPIILQSEVAECGLACLAMILSFYGYKSSVANLRGCMSGGLQGCNLQQLMDAAEEKHLGSRALQCELQEIDQLQTPCVLHWDMNHFVVLESVSSSNNKVVIVDPAKGRLTMDLAQFSQHFTGIALELSPNEGFELKDIRNPLRLKQLWSGIQGLPSQLVLMLLLSVVLQLCAMAMPYYMQIVMDEILLLADKSLMLVVFIGFCLITLFSTVASICRSFLLLRLSSLLSLFMGSNLFRHLSRLSMSFFEARHVGDVVSRFSSLGFIRERITQGVVETIVDGAMSVLVLALMFIYSPKLTFCVLAIALAYFLFRFVLYSRFKQANESLIECTAKEDSCFLETIRGMQAIRLFGAENKRLQNWQGRYADKINAEISIGHLNILYESFEKL